MFESLPDTFRKHGLQADVRTLMLLRTCMEKELARTLGDLFFVLKGLITTSPKEYGPFTKAFYEYFLSIDIKTGEQLDHAILRSETFKTWRDKKWEFDDPEDLPDVREQVDMFLNEVHTTTYDIQKFLSGKDILKDDDPKMKDDDSGREDNMPAHLDRMADYRDIPLEELLRRMEEVAKQQKRNHRGGQHWIGQGGISPYGNQGAAAGGVRVGGSGGGKMARRVVGDKNYYPVDRKRILKDDTIDIALASLKGIEEESTDIILDIPKTIKEGVKQGGLFLPIEKEKKEQKIQVILLIDNGGWSMTPYIQAVTKLFSKMKRRFAHDLKTYYYHNTIYGGAYTDEQRFKYISIEKLLNFDKKHCVFVIGDADMAPYELSEGSLADWRRLKNRYQKMVWMNPMRESLWRTGITLNILRQTVPMFMLSPEGIEKAVAHINGRGEVDVM
ncbi:MAG: hypothetical protein AAF655_16425 [Bacteroidota bacterium]